MTWSLYHPCCIDCGTTEKRHISLGLCTTCYKRRLRAGTRPTRADPPWSSFGPACLRCGRTEVPHHARGLCQSCWSAEYRQTEAGAAACSAASRKWAQTERGASIRRGHYDRWLEQARSKEVVRSIARRTRERARGVSVPVPIGYEPFVLEAFGNRCASCGCDGALELDHHFPLEDGNPLLHNAVPLCRSCNAKKNSKQPLEFYGGWRATEILVLLHELRDGFAKRFGACLPS